MHNYKGYSTTMREFLKILLIIFILCAVVTFAANAQTKEISIPATTVVDNPLLEKVNYMSDKARQLDTLNKINNDIISGLSFWVDMYQQTVDTLDRKVQVLSDLNFNLNRENTLLIEENKTLTDSNKNHEERSLDCSKKNAKLEKDNARLKIAKNKGLFTNIGLMTLLTIATIVIVADNE